MNGIVAPQVEQYLDALAAPRDPLLARLEAQAASERIPVCGPHVGRLLMALATRAMRALEVGTAIGYSAIWLARGLSRRGGSLDTIELDAGRAEQARRNLAEAGAESVVRVIEGHALRVLATLDRPYDLIFVDAVKSEYPAYLEHVRRLLAPGGWLVVDNVLQSGGVAGLPSSRTQAAIDAVRAFNQALAADPEFETVVMPLRDGVSLSVRR